MGLGTFPLAGVYNPISDEQAVEVISTFIRNGGYYIDTAPMYGYGRVEKILGDGLKNVSRDEIFLISKCGKEIRANDTWQPKAKYTDVVKQCNDSLKRLQTDFLDLYLVHSPDLTTPYEETVRALIDLKKQGKVKEIGLSNVTYEQLKEYRKYYPFQIVQNRFSFINRSISPELQEYMDSHSIQFVPYQILEIAQLTGSVIEENDLGRNDLRGTLTYFQNSQLEEVKTFIADTIRPIAKKNGLTIGQLMMAWTLGQPAIPYVFVGTTKPKYVEINLRSDMIVLSEETSQELEHAYASFTSKIQAKFCKPMKEFRGLNEWYY